MKNEVTPKQFKLLLKLDKESKMAKKKPSVAKYDWKLTINSAGAYGSYYFTKEKEVKNFLELNADHGDHVLIEKGRFRVVKKYKVGAK